MGIPTLNLPNGHKIPVVGYGTAGRGEIEQALDLALEAGYRHIDTAFGYGTEENIGNVLKRWFDSGKLKREDIFVVTKLPSSAMTPDRIEESLKTSLKRLQLDYVDLYLIHHPIWSELKDPKEHFGERIVYPTDHVAIWKKLEEQVDAGRAKEIGVSNFNIAQIDRILKNARIKPAANQVENHLYLQQPELVKFCQDNGVVVVAFSPLGAPGRTEYSPDSGLAKSDILDPTVAKLAEKYKKSAGQILLRFSVQRNVVVIPKSTSAHRMKENIDLFDFTLTDEEFNSLLKSDAGESARLGFDTPNKPNVVAHPEWPYPRDHPKYYAVHKPPPKK